MRGRSAHHRPRVPTRGPVIRSSGERALLYPSLATPHTSTQSSPCAALTTATQRPTLRMTHHHSPARTLSQPRPGHHRPSTPPRGMRARPPSPVPPYPPARSPDAVIYLPPPTRSAPDPLGTATATTPPHPSPRPSSPPPSLHPPYSDNSLVLGIITSPSHQSHTAHPRSKTYPPTHR